MDEHDKALAANAHPADWANPRPASQYNLVVLGAGTGGLVTAAGAAGLGAKVALIEKHFLGGDCLNVGCVPSKCIIRSSRSAAEARDAGRFGVKVDNPEVDFSAVMERMRRLRAHISHHDSARRFKDLGVDVFFGRARFSGPNTVEVDGNALRFKKAVIATGARPVSPPIEGLQEAGFLTNETVFSLVRRPQHLVVFGAGPLGCELAQAFRRLGSEVTILEMAPQFLTQEDPDAAKILADSFKRDGINVKLETVAKRVALSGTKKVIHVESKGQKEEILADEILVGAGRAPNVDGLDLESAGVKYDQKQGVAVNDFLQTSNPRIYAVGDVCLKRKFTHTADASARIAIQNALFLGRKKLSALTVPWCTYTDPEIAHVGMYEKDAKAGGIEVETYTRNYNEVDRAIIDGEEQGFVKIHVKKGSDKILGATIVGRHAGEMIGEISLAIAAGVGLKTLAGVIHPYPTQAEAIKQAADAYNRSRLTPRIKKILGAWLRWSLCVMALVGIGRSATREEKQALRAIEFNETMSIPVSKDSKNIRIWMPIPVNDSHQQAEFVSVESPYPYRITQDQDFGNRLMYFEPKSPFKDGYIKIKAVYKIVRKERQASDPSETTAPTGVPSALSGYLESRGLETVNEKIKKIAEGATKGIDDPMRKARALYAYVLEHMSYDKSGAGWGRGDSVYACDVGKGNCTDFHSLFIALMRASRIPARFQMGIPLPESSEGEPASSYHCWAEFYIDGKGWVPVDISEAWKNPRKADYFFGNLDANRVLLSTGREILLAPRQEGPPLNYLSKPYVEINGLPVNDFTLERRFKEKRA